MSNVSNASVNKRQQQQWPRVLLSLPSFAASDKGAPPSFWSCVMTTNFIVAFLFTTELLTHQLLFSYQHLHPLLEIEKNRIILARHLGVDTLSCIIASALGLRAAYICKDILNVFRGRPSPPDAGYVNRVLSYHPEAFRLSLFFFAYQLKNLYDTIIHNDGPEFIVHHVFSLITAWGALSPYTPSLHYYAVFYFGLSEISTAILCILANFDDIHGVPGLPEAFPTAKVVLAVSFVIWFMICRCILWPVFSYFCAKDCWLALNQMHNDPRLATRKHWFRFFIVSLTTMTVLQMLFLAQIFIIAASELKNMGIM